jgi:hypothetical protein
MAIAEAVIALLDRSVVTGETIRVDGGPDFHQLEPTGKLDAPNPGF